MDFSYMMKRMFGTVTAEEEQAHRARLAAEQAAQLRAAPVQVAPPPAPVQPAAAQVPARVMPGNALSERQHLLDSAMEQLRQQGARNPTTVQPKRPPPIIGVRG